MNMEFKKADKISTTIVELYCGDDFHEWHVLVYKDKNGYIRGYSAQNLRPDSNIIYYNADGEKLGELAMSMPAEERKKVQNIIEELDKQFPNREELNCSRDSYPYEILLDVDGLKLKATLFNRSNKDQLVLHNIYLQPSKLILKDSYSDQKFEPFDTRQVMKYDNTNYRNFVTV